MSVAPSIGIRTTQIEAYDGGLNPEVPQGNESQFYVIQTRGSERSQNRSAFEIFDLINAHGQGLSFSDAALQPMVTKDLIEDSLRRIDIIFAEVATRVVTHANRLFGSVYGAPPAYEFQRWPFRWSGENLRALTICQAFVAAGYQVPRLRCNAIDSGIVDNQASAVLRPLFDIKAELMRQHFGLEVLGEVNPDEIDALLAGVDLLRARPGSDDHRRESDGARAVRHDEALGQESIPRPTTDRSEQARQGLNVWTWRPGPSDWDTFAALLKSREITQVSNPPLVPFPFSTSVVGSGGAGVTPIGGGGASGAIGSGTVVPGPTT